MSKNEQVRNALQEYFVAHPERSQVAVGRAIGVSGALVSQFLSGKYQGNNDDVAKKIEQFIERERERSLRPKLVFKFAKTSIARKIFEVATLCHHDCEIGVITSDAGCGKTWGVREYTRMHSDVILLECDPGDTARTVFSKLHKAVGLEGAGLITTMFSDVVEKLRGSGRLIIIDEAENLQYRALELLRRVHDKSEIGILMCGLPRLYSNLRGKRGEFAQLYSRVGVYARLKEPSENDVRMVIDTVVPDLNGVCKTFTELSGGSLRKVEKLMRRAMRIAETNDEKITDDLVRDAAQTLMF